MTHIPTPCTTHSQTNRVETSISLLPTAEPDVHSLIKPLLSTYYVLGTRERVIKDSPALKEFPAGQVG